MTHRGNAVLHFDLALQSPTPRRVSREAGGGDERQSPTALPISSGKARLIERGVLRVFRNAVGDEICCDGSGDGGNRGPAELAKRLAIEARPRTRLQEA